ncbi:hypothetical protein YC2023_023501 [Brassica napus]
MDLDQTCEVLLGLVKPIGLVHRLGRFAQVTCRKSMQSLWEAQAKSLGGRSLKHPESAWRLLKMEVLYTQDTESNDLVNHIECVFRYFIVDVMDPGSTTDAADCKMSFPSALCLGESFGEAEKRILIDTTYDIKSCIDAQEDSLDKSIGTSCLIGDEVFLTIKESLALTNLLSQIDDSPLRLSCSSPSCAHLRTPSSHATAFIFPSSPPKITLAPVAPLLLLHIVVFDCLGKLMPVNISVESKNVMISILCLVIALFAIPDEYSRTGVYDSTLLDQASAMECIPFHTYIRYASWSQGLLPRFSFVPHIVIKHKPLITNVGVYQPFPNPFGRA